MANFSRIEVTLKMKETGMVPVFYHHDLEVCKNVIQTAYNAGIRVFEFTNRGDFAHEIFRELKKYVLLKCPEMMLGIGSIIDAGTTALYLQLGADFIVSPILNAEMAKICNRRKVSWSPGCGSVTEVSYAEELGAEVVKIFPAAQVGGPDFVKAIKGPCPWTSIMPTGGILPTKESLNSWFDAGVHCVGIGSQLFSKELIENGKYEILENNIKNTLEIIKQIDRKI